ncbi:MAG: hypothetical protein FWD29_04905 [Micrococcales bacterium]|nr:hypothetical protein [Micrococcales bacterium]
MDFTREELEQALRAIVSAMSKCEKVQEKLKEGTPQHSLTRNRIEAFRIASALITRAIEEV